MDNSYFNFNDRILKEGLLPKPGIEIYNKVKSVLCQMCQSASGNFIGLTEVLICVELWMNSVGCEVERTDRWSRSRFQC